MRHYRPEGRIAEERRIRREEEREHIRLCNAGINQRHHVWESEEAKAEFNRKYSEWRQNYSERLAALDT